MVGEGCKILIFCFEEGVGSKIRQREWRPRKILSLNGQVLSYSEINDSSRYHYTSTAFTSIPLNLMPNGNLDCPLLSTLSVLLNFAF